MLKELVLLDDNAGFSSLYIAALHKYNICYVFVLINDERKLRTVTNFEGCPSKQNNYNGQVTPAPDARNK